ncbi:MAG: hypothetical protein FWG54_06715 [Bacteroidetes bacterium]|nr:hypothetical protein [Bacteroidota bacterium]
MSIFRNLLIVSLLALWCMPVQAQFVNRLNNAIQNAAERAAIRKAEEKTEEAVNKAVDKATEKGVEAAEKGAEAAAKGIEQGVAAAEKANNATPTEPDPYDGPILPAPKDADKFPFEHGTYVQVAEVMGIEVKLTTYFSRFGAWQAVEDKSEIKVFGFTTQNNKLQITKGTTHWDIDLNEKTGTKYELDPSSGSAEETLKQALEGNPSQDVEITELGQENYLGYACRKINVKYPALNMDVTCLCYGSLVLKSEGNMGPIKTSTRILSIDLNAPPASIFEVPAGVTIN